MGNDDVIAAEVRRKRAELGMTLARFAARMGVTSRAVQYWEAGTRRPSGPALKLIRGLKPRVIRP